MVNKFKLKSFIVIALVLFTYKFCLSKKERPINEIVQLKLNEKVVKIALTYLGTNYQYGGITSQGMDCSGLVYTSYKEIGIQLPRSSFDQSKKGKQIDLSNVQIGDLLFFKTDGSKKINNVGLVTEIQDKITFIHSSTSRGIILSNLDEKYWKNSFALAKRML